MAIALRFFLGAAFGSFLNVVALRYEGDGFLFGKKTTGGRSHCPRCRAALRWFELIPIVSFLAQLGSCRRCKASISLRYPAVELIAGVVAAAVPIRIATFFSLVDFSRAEVILLSALWIAAFLLLLLLALIDVRLYVIPNEINSLLFGIGVLIAAVIYGNVFPASFSMVGFHALLAGFMGNVASNRAIAAAFGFTFFSLLAVVSKGRGMGFGDVKLAVALGTLLGWPDVVLATMIAFVMGACVGLFEILLGKKNFKSLLPFGPFLSLGAAAVFFWGDALVRGYFQLFFF